MATINGTAGNDSLTGTSGDDTLNGLGGNDTLVGSGSADFYDGGAGNDTLDFRATAAGVSVSFSDGTVSGAFSGTFANIERVLGGNGADIIIGAAGGQNLSGRTGSDWLGGGAGVDTLWGGTGGDSFVFRETGTANADSVSDFASGSDVIVLDASVMSALGAEGQFAAGDARFKANATGTATDSSDRVIYETDTRQIWYDADGNGAGARQLIAALQSGATLVATDIAVEGGGAAPIVGTDGDDTLTGTEGDDSIEGRGGDDNLNGASGNDTLNGGAGNDSLYGGEGADRFIGGDGNDTLDGFYMADFGEHEPVAETLEGGQGDDHFWIDNAGDVFSDSGGIDTLHIVEMSWTLGAGFENLFILNDWSESGKLGIGNELDNWIEVSYAGSRLEGRGGNDTLIGAGGDGEGDNNNHLLGGDGADSIRGGAGNDTLIGGEAPGLSDVAADTLDGGLGDDVYHVGDDDDVILADPGGIDTVHAWAVDWTLGAGLENLVLDHLFGHVADGTGNELDNTIWSATEGGTIRGLGGNDTLVIVQHDRVITADGGAGQDTLIAANGTDHLLFSVSPGAANADLIRNFAPGGDKILLDATVHANLGAAGNFTAGDARFVVNFTGTAQDASDRVLYSTNTGELFYDADGDGALVKQLIATLEGIPGLTASDMVAVGEVGPGPIVGTEGNDTLIGTEGNDTIDGRGGDDSLYGGAGSDLMIGGDGNDTLQGLFASSGPGENEVDADTMDGGLGNDYFYVDNAGDVLSDSGGVDTVEAKDMGWTLAAGFENLIINNDWFESPATGIGNALDNFMRISYAGGRLEGLAGNDTLVGGTESTLLLGGEGNDVLNGSWDDDTLTGGAGSDRFDFDTPPEGGVLGDTITDFSSGVDSLQLDGHMHFDRLGASGTLSATDARFYAAAGASQGHDADDRLVYDTASGRLYLDVDGSGEEQSMYIATLNLGSGAAALAATDITVVNGTAPSGNVINGTSGDDSLSGGEGNDTIKGLAGNDTLRGFNGDDLLDGGADVDTMDGGQGNDRYQVTSGDVLVDAGGIDTVIASDIDWTLGDDFEDLEITGTGGTGGTGNDFANRIDAGATTTRVFLDGWGGNDTLIGGSGNDELSGRHGNDFIVGGDGNDALDPFNTQHGSDTLDGGLGDDGYYVDSAEDVLIDAGGSDTVLANVSWTLAAGFENLRFFNHTGDDNGLPGLEGYGNELANRMETYGGNGGLLDGRAGNDTLIGGGRDGDQLFGGSGNDVLTGVGTGDRFVFTVAPEAANADQITDFTPGGDKVVLDGAVHANIGGSGDFVAGDARFAANDTGTAQDTSDRVIYSTATGQLWYDADGSGAGARQLIATLEGAPAIAATDISVINGSAPGSTIDGTSGNDTLSGTNGDDTINGLGGNDLILAGSTGGADVIDGGDGRDSIEFKSAATGAIVVDFGAGTITGGSAGGSISFTSIERIVTGNFDDSLAGDNAAQNLTGQGGADTLAGAGGVDTLWGGGGNDVFIFWEMGTANADRISDWAPGADKVQLDDSAFTAIGALGNFAAGDGRFWSAAGATSGHDVNDRVIYNASTGSLYYDADGSGSGAAQLIATVQGAPVVAATDIAVI